MAPLSLAEEFALLCYSDDGSPKLSRPALDYGLSGSLLLELSLADRLTVVDKQVVVTDPTPVGHALVDRALARIATEGGRRPKHWVSKLSKGLREEILDGLVDAGILRRERDKMLWIFPRTRYPAAHGVRPPAEADARQRLAAAVAADGPVPARTAALCGVVRATGLDRKVLRDQPRDRVRRRLAEISAGDWASAAIKRTIEEVQSATVAAITAASVTTTTAGG